MQPTCTEKGYTGYQCSGCNDTEIDENSYVNAVGHNPKIENYKAATCTEDGYTGDKVCTVCGETVAAGEAIPAKGHTKVAIPAVAATCTKDGTTAGVKCSVCKEILLAPEKVPAKGHTWDDGKVTQKPTLTKEGVKTYTCTACDETKTEPIAKLTTCDAGEDCPTHNYKDVKSSQWYHLDVDYVVESGLMGGYGNGIFLPDNKLSRAEMVQVLYNWAGKPEVSNELTDFADANKISDYAVSAVKWAVEQDILRGDGSPRKLRPTDYAKRCEVAAMLHRYIV